MLNQVNFHLMESNHVNLQFNLHHLQVQIHRSYRFIPDLSMWQIKTMANLSIYHVSYI